VGYTYSKSIDQASTLSDPINPYDFEPTRELSPFDLTHNLVASYDYELPLDRISTHAGFRLFFARQPFALIYWRS
jgi:hypothetical protein